MASENDHAEEPRTEQDPGAGHHEICAAAIREASPEVRASTCFCAEIELEWDGVEDNGFWS